MIFDASGGNLNAKNTASRQVRCHGTDAAPSVIVDCRSSGLLDEPRRRARQEDPDGDQTVQGLEMGLRDRAEVGVPSGRELTQHFAKLPGALATTAAAIGEGVGIGVPGLAISKCCVWKCSSRAWTS